MEDQANQEHDAIMAAIDRVADWTQELDGSVMACAKALARIATALEGIHRGLETVDQELGVDG